MISPLGRVDEKFDLSIVALICCKPQPWWGAACSGWGSPFRSLDVMETIARVLFARQASLVKQCLLLWPLALIPSLVFFSVARIGFGLAGVDLSAISPPDRDPSWGFLLSSVLVAPVVETALLSLVIGLIHLITTNHVVVAGTSAFLWGTLHGTRGLLWFFGTAWSFFVFSSAYLVWKQHSYRAGFVAAALPHALVNFTAVVGLWVLKTQIAV